MDFKFKFEEISVGIKVCARFRPLNTSEEEVVAQGKAYKCVKINENSVVISDTFTQNTFNFDYLFGPEVSQTSVFEIIGKPAISDVLDKFNSTIFAYVATGSGKTHTMMGKLDDLDNRGIIPRIADVLTRNSQNFLMNASCLEIYRERLKDLVVQSQSSLKIKESESGVYIDGLSKVPFKSKDELISIFESAEKLRTVAATKLNRQSSRSHFLLLVEVIHSSDSGKKITSKLNLIDLAGSEKVMKSEVSGTTMEEAKKINLSLSALGKVICALSTSARHVPYRDSKLTRLLQDSLGGNSKTTLIVNCSQTSISLEESLSSLRFAQRAKLIKNTLKLVKEIDLESELKSVKLELSRTQSELKRLKNQSVSDFQESDDESVLRTLELQLVQNEKNILQLECETKDLKRDLKQRKENLSSNKLTWKLASLKSKNEKFINEHLEFKCKKLEEYLKSLKIAVSEALVDSAQEAGLCDVDEKGLEKMHFLDCKPGTKEFSSFYLKAEQFEKNLKKTLKVLNWKLVYLYGKNKIVSQSCINQQTELKHLENLIEKFRKHLKIVKDPTFSEFSSSKILDSKLDILKNQSLLWKTRMQLETNNQRTNEKVLKEINTLSDAILSEVSLKETTQSNIETVSCEIQQTTSLLIQWIEACKEKQQKLGLNVSEIEDLLKGIQSLQVS
jgi:kinesin family protein 5